MPGFDGTGPRGIGPLTGRGMGFCAVPYSARTSPGYPPVSMPAPTAYGVPQRTLFFSGRGRGRGFRGGRGRRGRW